jgi:hypothetical protein
LKKEKEELRLSCEKLSQELISQKQQVERLEMASTAAEVKTSGGVKWAKENASVFSESTMPGKKVPNNINLEDFADFNEQSLSESCCSEDSGVLLVDDQLREAIRRSQWSWDGGLS